ncbi:peptide deformylase [Haliovirga abyssi]|uniref:Peptide deformylase n=1 Tax=Haliovirga abyssi TaxID=2996794 RepID=A0AAU9DVN6_9FUSO|nr:peptide deformylase [Haliovirga abyssi]BDU50281.1 peptide deformylase [Haliovirga abyssi]
MILEIKKYGDPVLRKKSIEVEKIDENLKQLLKDMIETMYDAPGVGLAAPQIGINKKVVIIDTDGKLRKIINPVILERFGEEEIAEEGCLSIPNIYEKVKRPSKVKVKYLNEDGLEVTEEADGLLARAFQHEIDHLDGVLFVDKVSNIRKRLISNKLAKLKREALKALAKEK